MAELWEKQKGENSQLFAYFKIYLYELKKLPKTLNDVIEYVKKLPIKDEDSTTEGTLRHYNGDLIKVPTLNQLKNASSKWKWKERETAYQNYLVELDHQKDEQYFEDNRTQVDKLINNMISVTQDNVEELKSSDYKTSTKIQLGYSVARTLDLLNKNLRLNHGRPDRISESKNEHVVDAEVTYFGLEDLANAFNKGKKEYLKQKRKQK